MQALSRPFNSSKHVLRKDNWKLNMEVMTFEIKQFYETVYYSIYFIWSGQQLFLIS